MVGEEVVTHINDISNLQKGAGEMKPLKPKGNFEPSPHQQIGNYERNPESP